MERGESDASIARGMLANLPAQLEEVLAQLTGRDSGSLASTRDTSPEDVDRTVEGHLVFRVVI